MKYFYAKEFLGRPIMMMTRQQAMNEIGPTILKQLEDDDDYISMTPIDVGFIGVEHNERDV